MTRGKIRGFEEGRETGEKIGERRDFKGNKGERDDGREGWDLRRRVKVME